MVQCDNLERKKLIWLALRFLRDDPNTRENRLVSYQNGLIPNRVSSGGFPLAVEAYICRKSVT